MAFLDDLGVEKLVSLIKAKIQENFASKNATVSNVTYDSAYGLQKTINDTTSTVFTNSELKQQLHLNNVDNVRQYSASNPPPYPVTSVNGNTGAVTVNVPAKVSDLTNDSGFITGITSSDVTNALGYTPPQQDTTYESKAAASGGTAVSLVTTGEKYTWNNKGTYSKPSGGIPDSDIASAATWNAKGNGTITGITMNGASKGTSGIVDLGTVITAHQDISGKADKSSTVSNVAYDSTNKKITKTINGTTSDVVTAATLKSAMSLAKGDVGLGNVDNVQQYSASNPPPYPVTSVNGDTGAVTVDVPTKVSDLTNDSGYITGITSADVVTALGYTPPQQDTTYTPASANPLMDGTVAVGTSVKYAREDHRHPSDTNKVSMSGNETVAGNKTFSGTTSLTAASIYPASTGTAIPANAAAIIQSPMPKYLWHDVFAFCRDCTPSYYTTTDGTTWTEATLNKNLFLHKMAWGRQMAISNTVKGSRWIWQTSSWSYSSATWLLIGVSYTATNAYFDILLETANSAGDWTTLLSKENCYYNSTPVWFKTNTPGSAAQVRLTIIRNANDATTNELPITSIRWLASRWGDQGRGEEFEYPYQWNENLDVYPTSNNVSNLGTSSVKWNTVYASTFSGNATSATKASQDESGNNIKATYAASASISGNTLTLKNKNNETLSTATIPSELPSVSSSDNDKVLTVVNGSWAAESPGSSGNTLVVTVSYSSSMYVSDTSYDDICTAIENGSVVKLKYSTYWYDLYSYTPNGGAIYFYRYEVYYNSVLKYGFYITKSNGSTRVYSSNSTANIPTVPNCIYDSAWIEIYLDTSVTPPVYRAYSGELSDISQLFYDNSLQAIALTVWHTKSHRGEDYTEDAEDADYELYQVVKTYTTHPEFDYDEWLNHFTGHIVASNISIDNGVLKYKTFTISGEFNYWNSLQDCTVTYSETTLGEPPAATGVSF